MSFSIQGHINKANRLAQADCKCLDSLGSPVTILQVLSELNGQGWKFVRCYGRRINAL